MDIYLKSVVAALLGAILLIAGGRALLLTNDLRNYPGLKPNRSVPTNGTPGIADVDPQSKAAQAAREQGEQPRAMSQGEEEATKSGYSTELDSPGN